MTVRPTSLVATLLALIGIPFGQTAQAGDQVPAAWITYAQEATLTVISWVNTEDPPAPRIRAVLEETRPAPDQPTPPLVVKIWVGRSGAITRVEFPPLNDAQATQDLQALLTGRKLAVPPKGMRQPMRLGLQLAPRPDSQASST
jgi:hypothetical protein